VAVHLIAQVCDALAAAHGAGVGHLHVKPANVLLDLADPDDPFVRVTDFGLTHLAPPGSAAAMMLQAEPPDYIAPEVWAGRSPELASDVYAVGVMLYELVVGRTPFGVDPNGGELVSPDGFPATLWWWTAACLSPDPAARPAMAELTNGLHAALPELLIMPAPPAPATPDTSLETSPETIAAAGPPSRGRRPRRRTVAATVLVAAVALLASVLDGLAIGGSSEVSPTANGLSAGPSALGAGAPSGSPGATPSGGVSATLVSASRLTGSATPRPSATTTGTTAPSAATVSAPVSVGGDAPTQTDATITSAPPPPTQTTAAIDWQCTTTDWNDNGTDRPVTTCVGTDGSALYVSGSISNAPPDENELQLRLYLGSNSGTYRSYTYTGCSGDTCQLTETVAGAVAGTYHSRTNSLSGSDLRFASGSSPDLTYP
jgi:serine/threonine-protein kinase